MYPATILCLANSRKRPSGRCIAGKVLLNGAWTTWLRPVSARQTHEVSEEERRYENGAKAQLLDIVCVPLREASPIGHQVENHTLDDHYYWEKQGVATWNQVVSAVDPYDPAFWSHSQSTYHGLRDKVAEADLSAIGSSLRLILVEDLIVSVKAESGFEGNPSRRRARAKFTYGGVEYWLSLTDPEIEELYLQGGNVDTNIGQAALCISLVEVWNGYAFRVVASLITPARAASFAGG